VTGPRFDPTYVLERAASLLDPIVPPDLALAGVKSWREVRRDNQSPPDDPRDWYLWLILAGRGWGKTRTGAEWLLDEMTAFPRYRYGMLCPTFDEGRDVMVEGPSGIIECAKARNIHFEWNRSLGHFIIRGGARADLYPAE